MKMSKSQAKAIYDILVQECGARDDDDSRSNFVSALTFDECSEYRFCGMLGFGGKFYCNCGRLYVSCYQEDETPRIRDMMDKANARLKAV